MKLTHFDMSKYLDSNEAIEEYLNQVLEDGDNTEFIRAIGYIAKAKGMSAIAKDTGLGRESLYKAFNGDANPRFDTVMKVIKSLGIKLYTQTHVKKVAV
ncbi:Putative addiction module antidote protein [Sulfurovum sp. enrichment culture clone C5]|uniref:Putative addiction module antidote protein n=1 Tax=Sulfurovum sp. enrichment culture clone C5 TaxID=497650 RepID=A0A0S4XLY4_9BACT|nr:Putative addiction module antidote protein [Sulfurovum sp. enrichment culture clone C5]